ncbi:MAG TPA: hypothetical protein VFN21_06540 [Acidimicrobiales bacterium]|nr:hypothetical protein [Acidimicrobiales bacterium]
MIAPTDIDPYLPDYLARQPWFAHGEARNRTQAGDRVDVGATVRHLEVWREGNPGLMWAILDTTLDGADVGSYQVLIGLRPSVPSPGFLIGATSRILGTLAGDGSEWLAYDALVDPELTIVALAEMFDDLHGVRSVRKLTAGKTSTSVVADEAWLCKVFRRVRAGDNPGVEMPAQLWDHGFRATLETVESWRHIDMDLALRRPFLPGAANGLDLAEASLRELFASGLDPQLSPGDFSAEARRIGRMLADMHVASEHAYGVTSVACDDLLSEVADDVIALGIYGLDPETVRVWATRCGEQLDDELPTVRVHGNLHLGQLLRSDQGWLILDFEGAPLLPTAERRRPRPGWFDVGSMLRSFDYVAAMTRAARVESELEDGAVLTGAAMWVDRNTRAFLDGYRLGRAVDAAVDITTAVQVGEVARAAYEVAYERANRPDLAAIPVAALQRLIVG